MRTFGWQRYVGCEALIDTLQLWAGCLFDFCTVTRPADWCLLIQIQSGDAIAAYGWRVHYAYISVDCFWHLAALNDISRHDKHSLEDHFSLHAISPFLNTSSSFVVHFARSYVAQTSLPFQVTRIVGRIAWINSLVENWLREVADSHPLAILLGPKTAVPMKGGGVTALRHSGVHMLRACFLLFLILFFTMVSAWKDYVVISNDVIMIWPADKRANWQVDHCVSMQQREKVIAVNFYIFTYRALFELLIKIFLPSYYFVA